MQQRYIIRFLVAVLTFIIGLMLSAVLGLFHSPATKVPPVTSHHRWSEFTPSPLLSIETQQNGPLKLLYSSTSIDTADANKRQVHFVVENTSRDNIKAYTISYSSSCRSDTKGAEGAVFVQAKSQKEIFKAGELQTVTIECDADRMLSLWIASAEFVDGSHWSNGQYFK
jgi:hypothetical protein